jgi:serine phosphatase RsbU (regulator of sigma subunit)/CheY-like chemotaxis protein
MPAPVILCVDDERIVLSSLQSELQDSLEGRFAIEVAESGAEALELLAELRAQGIVVPVVLSDLFMPGMNGDELLVRVRQIDPSIRTVLLTGQPSADAIGRALNEARLYRFVSKPWQADDLRMTLEQAAKSYSSERELADRLEMLERLHRTQQAMASTVSLLAIEQAMLTRLVADLGAARVVWLRTTAAQVTNVSVMSGSHAFERMAAGTDRTDWPSPDGVPRALVVERMALRLPLLLQRPALSPEAEAHPELTRPELGSAACLPVLKGDRLLGLLWIEFAQREALTPLRQDYLNILVPQAAIALDNAQFMLDLESRIRERTATLEQKNADLADSLRYASRIQTAILPNPAALDDLLGEQFLLHISTAEVSGAFYWSWHAADELVLVIGDAAGSGVPAAFMSVLTHSLLGQVVSEQGQRTPEAVLRQLDRRIAERLTGVPDPQGVGLAVIYMSKQAHGWQVQAAGSGVGAIAMNSGECLAVPMGQAELGLGRLPAAIATTEFALAPGDRLYLYTDGLVQQPGDASAEGWGTERWQAWLATHHALDLAAQKARLHATIASWRGQQPAVDDVLVWAIEA